MIIDDGDDDTKTRLSKTNENDSVLEDDHVKKKNDSHTPSRNIPYYNQGAEDSISYPAAVNQQAVRFGGESDALFERLSKEIMEANKIAIEAKIEAAEAKRESTKAMEQIQSMMTDANNWQTNYAQQEIYDFPPPVTKVSSQQTPKPRNANDMKTSSPLSDGNDVKTDLDSFDYDTLTNLTEDTYTLMMITKMFHKSWNFGFVIFVIQFSLLGLIFWSAGFNGGTFFDIPFRVEPDMRVAQFIAIFITVMISYDVFMPIKDLTLLWINESEWLKVVSFLNTNDYRSLRNLEDQELQAHHMDRKRMTWFLHIFLPSMLKFLQGLFALLITFVIVIQSDNTMDLFKDFAAMQVISELDNVGFYLCNHGYFGSALKRDSDAPKNIKIKEKVPTFFFGIPLRPLTLYGLLLLLMSIFVGTIVVHQVDGTFFYMQYPNCDVAVNQIHKISDDMCNNGLPNTFQCGFDGGGKLGQCKLL